MTIVAKDVVLCLYDVTGNMAAPWVENGYKAVLVDVQHPSGMAEFGAVTKIGADIRGGWMPDRELVDRVAFVAAFPDATTWLFLVRAGCRVRVCGSWHGQLTCSQRPQKYTNGSAFRT